MLKKLIFVPLLFPLATFAGSNNIDFLNFSSQDEFKKFSEDLTGAYAYKTLIPAEPLGITGFDIGVSYGSASLNNKLMGKVAAQSKDNQDMLGIHLVKGLPLGIDLGIDYVSGLNEASTLGGSLSYALLDGGMAYPALNIKGFYNQSNGMKAVDFTSYGAEVGISKGLANFTPFASVGLVNGNIKPSSGALFNTSSVTLANESVSMMKYAVGVNVNLLIMDILVGYNQIGDVPTYSIKAGYRF